MKKSTTIIAEIAQSYEGDYGVLINIIDALCKTQVDMVMFQVVFADELATKENNNYDFFKSLEFNVKELNCLTKRIRSRGKKIVAEVFGVKSANIMLEAGVDAYKVHPADVSNIEFLMEITKTGLPIYMGVGGCTENEMALAVDKIKENKDTQLTLMHGYQAAPTPIEESNFKKIKKIKDVFSIDVGYSDHSPGSIHGNISILEQAAIYSPAIALVYGASVIEKHVILNRDKVWEDYESALTPSELDLFISYVRQIERSLGDYDLKMNSIEKKYRASSKKYIVANKNLVPGSILKRDDIDFKRIKDPNVGLINYDEIDHRVINKALGKDQPITHEDVI